jgi:hypothetical protein
MRCVTSSFSAASLEERKYQMKALMLALVAATALTFAAPAFVGSPFGADQAFARRGADDPAGDDRGGRGRGADDGANHASNPVEDLMIMARRGRGADDAPGHVRQCRGCDDGANHT